MHGSVVEMPSTQNYILAHILKVITAQIKMVLNYAITSDILPNNSIKYEPIIAGNRDRNMATLYDVILKSS